MFSKQKVDTMTDYQTGSHTNSTWANKTLELTSLLWYHDCWQTGQDNVIAVNWMVKLAGLR